MSLDDKGQNVVNSFNLPSACLCHHTRDSESSFEGFELRFATKTEKPPLPFCSNEQGW